MHTRPDSSHPAAGSGTHSFFWLLSAYFLPLGLFLDPEANGSWSRWQRRRDNINMLRRYSFTFARRWAALWLLASVPAQFMGGTAGDVILCVAGVAIIPAMIFACARLAADITGDDLPL